MALQLYPHQVKALDFGIRNPTHLIADEPGLGKTIQALAIDRALGIPPGLCGIVAPRNVLRQWEEACALFGLQAALRVNYEQVPNQVARLRSCRHLIVDESHMLMDPDSLRFRSLVLFCQDPFKRLTFLTGTPLFSYPRDLFAQLYLLRLITWDQYGSFILRYCDPVPKIYRGHLTLDTRGLDRAPELRSAFQPYILRRTWADVGIKMPPLTITDVELGPEDLVGSAADRSAYQRAAGDFTQYWKKERGISPMGLERYTVERHLLSRMKCSAVIDELAQELRNDVKILVFTEFRDVAEIIQAAMAKICDHSYLVLGGGSDLRRQAIFDIFKLAPGRAVVSATLDCLSAGVDGLQVATRVFMVDQGIKPTQFTQAVLRSWRLKQDKPVSMKRFVAPGTIDDWVNQNNCRKEDYMAELGFGSPVPAGIRR